MSSPSAPAPVRVYKIPRYLFNLAQEVNSSFPPLLVRELLIGSLAGSVKVFPKFLAEDLDVHEETLLGLIDHLQQNGWIEVDSDWTPKRTAFFELFGTPKLQTRAAELRDEARSRFEQNRR